MAYSIGEVAKILEVSPQSIRLWEKMGFIPSPRRTLTNRRLYTDEDVSAIKRFLKRR